MKAKNKILLTSCATIALSASLIAGSTFALFTSDSTTNIAVTSGKVNVVASIKNVTAYSYEEIGDVSTKTEGFVNGGTAEYKAATNTLEIVGMTPGDWVEFDIVLTNESTVDVQYRTSVNTSADKDDSQALFEALDFTAGELSFVDGGENVKYTTWTKWEKDATEKTITIHSKVELPLTVEDNNNENGLQEAECSINFKVEAVQGNANVYDPEVANPEWDGENIKDVADLMAFRDAVNGGDTMSGKTVTLKADLDLGDIANWEPIGTYNHPFSGKFDGQGHTVSGMKIETSEGDKALGFFGEISNAEITHVKVSGSIKSTAQIESYPPATYSSETYAIGGICGVEKGSKISLCTNAVNIDVSEATCDELSSVYVGGILGLAIGTDNNRTYPLTLENCLNEGTIILPVADVFCMAGGIAGSTYKYLGPIQYLVNVGELIGSESELHYVGEIVGLPGGDDMSTWYSTNSANLINPLLDEDDVLKDLTDHYISGELTEEAFVGFDFNNIWQIVEGKLSIR